MQRTIAIVGAGFSGTITAVQLLRRQRGAGLRVLLIEHRAPFGRGLAYRTWNDDLLLNVPAGNMSALADDPGHFVTYIRNIDPNFNPGSFIPRRIYGDYLEDTLAQARRDSGASLELLSAEVVSVLRGDHDAQFALTLSDGRRVAADQVVLALGHFPPVDPPALSPLSTSDAYIANPWDFGAIDRIGADHAVALIGAGHTAIDALFRLTSRGDRPKVFLLSRRGLLPHGHRSTPRQPTTGALPPYLAQQPGARLREDLRAIRSEVRRHEAAGGDWRDVLNELRPHTPALWQRLGQKERLRFLDRVLPFWDVHRHRLAPAAHLRLGRMLASGQVEALAGRIVSTQSRGAAIDIVLRRRGDGLQRQITVGAVINCTGPSYDLGLQSSPLVRQLLGQGLLRQDPLKLGLETDERYRVIDRHGQVVGNLYYIGPMLKARLWEAIAVPELRVHGHALAGLLLSADVALRAAPGTDPFTRR